MRPNGGAERPALRKTVERDCRDDGLGLHDAAAAGRLARTQVQFIELMIERTTSAMQFKGTLVRIFIIGLGVIALLWVRPLEAQVDRSMTWSPQLHLKSIEDIPDQLQAPVLKGSQRMSMTNDKVSPEVGNCSEYLNAVAAGFYADESSHLKGQPEYFVYECYILRDLQHAQAATSTSSYRWTEDSLNELPPMLIVGSKEVWADAEQAEKRGESWKQYDPTLKIDKIQGDLLLAEDQDEAYSLEILARGDFNGEGTEDIAVYGTIQGKHSTYSHVVYLILSPASNGKLVRLTSDTPPYRIRSLLDPDRH